MNKEIQAFLTKESRDLLNFIFDGVYIVDTRRRIHFWNKGAQEITGYTAEEVMGKCCKDNILNHIDENGNLMCVAECPLTRAIKSGQNTEMKVYPLHKSGRRYPVSTHVGPIRNKDGKIIGGIEVFRDISAQEKLLSQERKFRKLIKQYVSGATYDSVSSAVEADDSVKAATRDLTILFMDIVGFTTLSEMHPPKKIVEVLNSLFSFSSHIIQKHTGDIDKFVGDCSMAIFIDAQDAVNMAKEMISEGLPRLNTLLKSKGLPQINVRIGINSGKLVQGDIGSDDRKDMTVIGDVVNTASRVEGEAEPGSFMITESALARLDNPGEFEFAKELLLKGKIIPIKLYRLKLS
ncbi:adenylate/guanylate cyclase domain-containing protein [Desulfobacterales bacterium HSG2]|nr:adenylate/guanylate cyclase domain-containing protein [Desulfobacterales bacterium HSG2]